MLNEKCLVCGKKHETWDEITQCFKSNLDKVDWNLISECQTLSENFIREFKDEVNWDYISKSQTLSKDFIREFKDKVNWNRISQFQTLPEGFIREFKDKVDWGYISECQTLSEGFIKKFKDIVGWYQISEYQTLSEDFIREFKDEVNWNRISRDQTLSEDFIQEFKDKLVVVSEYQFSYSERTFNPTLIEDYAKKHNLEIKDGYLYAFRNHDGRGGGVFNSNKIYKKGQYYQDWHLDLNPNHKNSYGFGIWPEGNTSIKVKVEDWGTEVNQDPNGKARVKGFEII